jgi:hypothetical protein
VTAQARILRVVVFWLAPMALVGLGLGGLPSDGWARGKRSARKAKSGKSGKGGKSTRFYDFDDLLIDGEFRKPATLYTRALKSPKFERLLRLQKSFLNQLLQTARYPSLRWFR